MALSITLPLPRPKSVLSLVRRPSPLVSLLVRVKGRVSRLPVPLSRPRSRINPDLRLAMSRGRPRR